MTEPVEIRDKHIVLVVDNYPPRRGGAELVYERLAEGLAAAGNQVRVLTTGVEGAPRDEQRNGVTVRRLGRNRYGFIIQAFFYLLFSGLKPDLVQTATYGSALPAWLFAKLKRVPVVLTIHELLGEIWFAGMNRFRGRFFYWFERLIIRLPFDRMITGSRYTADRLISAGVPEKKVKIIPYGVDSLAVSRNAAKIREQLNIPADQFLFLFFGRLGISKGIQVLHSAMQKFLADHPDTQLALVVAEAEHGDLYRSLQELQQQFPAQVTLLAALPKPTLVDLVASADCIVVPSSSEGFGLSAIEACMLNRPVVSSDGGALADNLWGKINYFPAGNAAALIEALEKARLGEFSTIAKQTDFTWAGMINGYRRLYAEVL